MGPWKLEIRPRQIEDDVPRSVENAKRSLRCPQYHLMLLRQAFVRLSCLVDLHSECQAPRGASRAVCEPSASEGLSLLPTSPQPSTARPWTSSASASHCDSLMFSMMLVHARDLLSSLDNPSQTTDVVGRGPSKKLPGKAEDCQHKPCCPGCASEPSKRHGSHSVW